MRTVRTTKRTYTPKKRTKKTYKKAKVSKPLKTYIKRAIHASEENKIQMVDVFTNSVILGGQMGGIGAGGLVSSEILTLLNVVQGAAQNQRIGNSIRPVSIQLRGVLRSNTYNNITNGSFGPVEVHMFVYKVKNNFTSSSTVNILQSGVGSVPFSGTVINSTYPTNKDIYKIYARKVFKLNFNTVGAPTGGNTYPEGNNNGGQMMRRFKINIPISHKLSYNDNSAIVANDGLFVAFGTINCDGSNSLITDTRAVCNMEAIITYEDA